MRPYIFRAGNNTIVMKHLQKERSDPAGKTSRQAGWDARQAAEMARQMTLVRETHRQGNLRQR